ncbi:MAG: hypothetical protein Kapaf2KO_03010 [Candidatus Kapaibacteriales bacterium]
MFGTESDLIFPAIFIGIFLMLKRHIYSSPTVKDMEKDAIMQLEERIDPLKLSDEYWIKEVQPDTYLILKPSTAFSWGYYAMLREKDGIQTLFYRSSIRVNIHRKSDLTELKGNIKAAS